MKLKQTLSILLCATITSTWNINAQVTIGSGEKPAEGALLDLKMGSDDMSTKGLGLPQVELKNIKTETDLGKTMGATATGTLDAGKHAGLLVYNTGKNESSVATRFCPGIHIWNGNAWQPVVPYPTPIDTRILQSTTPKGFKHLTNASDPMWAALGKQAGNYPLGHIGTFTDNRPNDTSQTYHYTRFYVGYTSTDSTFSVTRDLSCEQDGSATSSYTETVTGSPTFEDGIWMGENLRAIKMPDGSDINIQATSSVNSSTIPYYQYPESLEANRKYGVLYNWPAVINIGTNPGQTPDPGDVEQGRLKEGSRIQGICPEGWYLPSDRQWTDLENGIIINTSKFSTTADIGIANILPYETNYIRGTHGPAMITTTYLDGRNPNGTSLTAAQGGFDAYLAGHISINAWTYSTDARFWSASGHSPTHAWYRYLRYNNALVESSLTYRYMYHAVRCMKND